MSKSFIFQDQKLSHAPFEQDWTVEEGDFALGNALQVGAKAFGKSCALEIGPWKDPGRAKSKVEEMLADAKYEDKECIEK